MADQHTAEHGNAPVVADAERELRMTAQLQRALIDRMQSQCAGPVANPMPFHPFVRTR